MNDDDFVMAEIATTAINGVSAVVVACVAKGLSPAETAEYVELLRDELERVFQAAKTTVPN